MDTLADPKGKSFIRRVSSSDFFPEKHKMDFKKYLATTALSHESFISETFAEFVMSYWETSFRTTSLSRSWIWNLHFPELLAHWSWSLSTRPRSTLCLSTLLILDLLWPGAWSCTSCHILFCFVSSIFCLFSPRLRAGSLHWSLCIAHGLVSAMQTNE